ncbi:helix-turn-helix domain-containing protein [Candidatus Micrarchaeota archaeon]|nr:helix-turn-helix domain-containing protein [Candidatus Micrarchaeota archaeon]
MAYADILGEVGLSTNESKVYESLLSAGSSSIEQIALKSKVHRRNIYDVLGKLLEKGLISETFVQNRKEYRAINPSRLIDLIQEKERKVQEILPELEKKFTEYEEEETAYMYKGINGVKQYLQDILDVGETVYFIGAKALWLDPRLKHFLVKFDRERRRKGITFMHIFDYEVNEQKPEILRLVGKPYKFLPKNYTSPTCVDIFGDRVVTFVGVRPGQLDDEPVQFVLKSKRLAEGYKKFFNFMWDRLE